MNWMDFHFSCRYLSTQLSAGNDLKSAQNIFLKEYRTFLSGNPLNNEIYRKVISINNVKEQQKLLSTYGLLNLSWDNSGINKLSNIRNYIFLLNFIFLLLSSICLIYVIPTFKEIFQMMDVPIIKQLDNFIIYWVLSFSLLAVVSLGILRLNDIINRLDLFSSSITLSFLSKTILSKKVTIQIHKIEALIYAPFNERRNQYSDQANTLITMLKRDNLDLFTELQFQFNKESKLLTKLINSQVTKLMCLFSIIVIAAIYNFISSLYAPLFYIGTI